MMDYAPPPATAEQQLIISIDEAQYDVPGKTASIIMSEAFQKSGQIQGYHGKDITLIYKNETPDLKACPPVRVPLQDIRRSIDFTVNTVTITISNIEKPLADKIAQTLCLRIDTETVKKVSNPNYQRPRASPDKPFDNLNE